MLAAIIASACSARVASTPPPTYTHACTHTHTPVRQSRQVSKQSMFIVAFLERSYVSASFLTKIGHGKGLLRQDALLLGCGERTSIKKRAAVVEPPRCRPPTAHEFIDRAEAGGT